MTRGRRCDTCEFSELAPDPQDGPVLECHLTPPMSAPAMPDIEGEEYAGEVGVAVEFGMHRHPHVASDDWCGAWRPRWPWPKPTLTVVEAVARFKAWADRNR